MAELNVTIAPADQADRDRILTDLNTTLLVEAGAGSGKTTSLVGRLLALIELGVRIDQIAAITFTNKAADEMKERFRLALEKAHRQSSDDSVARERLSEALGRLDLLFIGTIHSFCGMMLRERPIEAGLDPSFEELDEDGDKMVRAISWDEFMAELDDSARVLLAELQALRVDVNTLRTVYDRVSLFTDVELPCQEQDRPNFDRIRETLFPMLEEAVLYIPTNEPDKGWDTLQKLIRQSRAKMKFIDLSDDMRILELAQTFDRKLDVTLNRWTSKPVAGEMKKRLADWQINVLFPFLQQWREYMYPKLIAFVRPALDYCRERRFAAGKLNFQDLLMEATKLVRDNMEVRAYFSGRYKRLLVDEFQDTDPIQAELLFLLTGESTLGTGERDWRRLTPRPGSLFVVGDPKQSIYRFRRADISIYNEMKVRIQKCGAVLRLTANFRSVRAIGDFINGQFVGKLPTVETEHQASFVRMETRAAGPSGGRKTQHGIYVLSYEKMSGGKSAVAHADAERIARYIAWACNGGNVQVAELDGGSRPAVPSDFLILTKTREFIHLYAEQLDAYGVPADTSGSTTVYEELLALWQLVCYLDDPADKPALLAVMRGMLFGLSDRALWNYKQEGHRFSPYDVPALEDCGAEAAAVADVLGKLRLYADWVRGYGAATAFSRIVEHLGLLPYISTLTAGSVRAGTLVRMLQILHADPAASASWPALRASIENMLSGRGMETSSLYAGGNQAVRIMNLHKAKGLEAPVVFLACPCGESDHDVTQFIDRSTDPAAGYFTISRELGEFKSEVVAQPPGWAEMNERERLFCHAEKDRLLYVAATRPKQMLVISLLPEQPAKCPWTPLMDGMELARELNVPEFVPEPKAELSEVPDLQAAKIARQLKLDAIGTATYEVMSVTGLTKSVGERPVWAAEGKGMAFGSVVHRALDMLGKGMADADLADAVQLLAQEEGLDARHVGEAERIVRSVLASELWQRSLRARRRLFEVPLVMYKQAGEETGRTHHAFVRGVIDFLFEEDDGWVIVDFKTDSVTEEKLQPFVEFYRPQVLAYASEWERTFGLKVKGCMLYFVQLDCIIHCTVY